MEVSGILFVVYKLNSNNLSTTNAAQIKLHSYELGVGKEFSVAGIINRGSQPVVLGRYYYSHYVIAIVIDTSLLKIQTGSASDSGHNTLFVLSHYFSKQKAVMMDWLPR